MSILATIILLLLTVWATAALYVDLTPAWLRLPLAAVYSTAMLVALFWRRPTTGRLVCLAGFTAVLLWWLQLKPSNTRQWQPDVSVNAYAEIDGDKLTIHNVRYCDYRTETDYTPRWETRTYDLSALRGADMFITYWGSPYIAHPIVSFDFGNDTHLAVSIETRKEVGEEYSAIRGFFRQYELIFVPADERDVFRLRTNFRKGEDVYLYRTTATPEKSRAVLLNYVETMNRMRVEPVWYNALTENCTTDIRLQTEGTGPRDTWDYRIIVNGLADQMMYENGRIVTGGLPFDELKRRAHINEVARRVPEAEFSHRVREGKPGF